MFLPRIAVVLLMGTAVFLVVVPVILWDDRRRGTRVTAGRKILTAVAGILGFMFVSLLLLMCLVESR